MSEKLRRACSWSMMIVGAQALAFAAGAQQTTTPDSTRQSTTTTGAVTGTGTTSATEGADLDRARSAQSDTTRERDHSMHSDRAKGDKAAMKNVTPQTFASQAAAMSKAEIELSELALNKTKNEEIRLFAERMIKDHGKQTEQLKQIASQQNISLPQSTDAEHARVKQKLAGLQGEEFDREFKKQMAKDHEKAVALFQSASQAQQMPEELREFAASSLSTLKDHHEDAQDMVEEADEGA